MKHKKVIFGIVGESSSGKDSIANELEQQGYKVLKSYATRPRRLNESDTHIFISKEEVKQYKDDMVAYTKIGEYEYFSTQQQLQECDIYIIDPRGIDYLKEKITNIRIVTIYINVNEFTRIQRARLRSDNEIERIKRFIAEYDQFKDFKTHANFDYSVSNIDFNKAIQVIKKIIDVEKENN